jgi:hypothetical protein
MRQELSCTINSIGKVVIEEISRAEDVAQWYSAHLACMSLHVQIQHQKVSYFPSLHTGYSIQKILKCWSLHFCPQYSLLYRLILIMFNDVRTYFIISWYIF